MRILIKWKSGNVTENITGKMEENNGYKKKMKIIDKQRI